MITINPSKPKQQSVSAGSELDRRIAGLVFDIVVKDSREAEDRVRAVVRENRLSRAEISHLGRILFTNGHPDLGLELISQVQGPTWLHRLRLRTFYYVKPEQMLSSAPLTLAFPLLSFLRRPRQGLGKAKRLLTAWPAQRRAVREYPQMQQRMKKLIEGRRVLVLGSGPSVKAVQEIPDDVIVVGINRSPAHLMSLEHRGAGFIWALCLVMAREHWDHVEEIAQQLPAPDLVLPEFRLHRWWRWGWGPHQWNAVLKRTPYFPRRGFIPIDDDDVTAHLGLDRARYSGVHLTMGVNLLRHVLAANPAEVYVAGIDLGYAGKAATDHAYFYKRGQFLDEDGQPVVSRQRALHPIDEVFVRDLGKGRRRVYSVSEESRIANYFEVKPLV